ncbi:MAG TPA: nuclear transport factor 2 family protein [Blastocatellia bacterium]|nr:nuclear transport factor 2 family protein [Blastocatellia bacterium]
MKRIRSPFALTLGLAILFVINAFGRNGGPERDNERLDADSVRAVERAWTKAFLTGDTDYLDGLLEPDYESVTYSGQVRTKQEIIEKARAHKAHPLPMPALKEPTIQIHGSAAFSRVDEEVEDPQTKRKHTVRFLDFFVFYDGRWHVLYTQDVAVTAK